MAVVYLPERRFSVNCGLLLLFMTILILSSCYYDPYYSQSRPAPKPQPQVTADPYQLSLSQVYFYPKAGQTDEQQSRDHYECYNWAIKQTGFDPGQSPIPKDQRVRVVPMPPPGNDTAAMAIAGAVLGALFGGPHHAAEGAMIGAAGGAMIGAASDTARMEQARQREEYYAAQNRARNAQLETKAYDFRRAMCACMEGRGYSTK